MRNALLKVLQTKLYLYLCRAEDYFALKKGVTNISRESFEGQYISKLCH